jgi:diguanylate cyclase (GGDEF)-like protein/PAS domain S-box-containing protein
VTRRTWSTMTGGGEVRMPHDWADAADAADAAAQRQAVLVEVAQSLSESVDDPGRLAVTIVDRIAELVGDAISVWVLSAAGDRLECAAVGHRIPEARQMLEEVISGTSYERREGILWYVVDSGKPLIEPEFSIEQNRLNAHPALKPFMERYGTHSIVALPLSARGRVLAVMGATRGAGAPAYTDDDVSFMQALCDLAALALDQAGLLADARAAQAELRRTASLVEQVSDAIISTDLDWRIESWNPAAEAIYGYSKAESLSRRLDLLLSTQFLLPSGAPVSSSAVRRSLDKHGSWRGEVRERGSDFGAIELTCSMTVTTDGVGTPTGVVVVNRDMSERRNAERELEAREKLSRSVLDAVEAHTAVLDGDGRIVAVNQAWESFTPVGGCGRGGVGSDYVQTCQQGDEHSRAAAAGVQSVLRGERPVFQLDYAAESAGGVRWYNLHVVPLGEPGQGAVVSHTDITWRKRLEVDLAHQATHDALTGLPNRVLLGDRLQHALERALRNGTQMAVLFLDLDHFKVVNDSLGHEVGDLVLRTAADRLLSAVRPSDTVTRFGGDEFVIVAEDVAGASGATVVAERVLAAFTDPMAAAGHDLHVSPSVGIAISGGADAPELLLRDADAAMYRAKESGRARFAIFDESLGKRAARRMETEQALRRAIDHDELRLLYQPQLDIHTGQIVAAEALLRWQHPELGLLGPWSVVPLAEETGLIVPIGRWVIGEAVRQAAAFAAAGHPLVIGVNLSPVQLAEPTLVNDVGEQLRLHDVPAERICLEITESAVMGDPDTAVDRLRRFSSLGVSIAVDDFGTGYSSLTYLRHFPIDVLKVDQSFVAGLGKDAKDDAVVSAVIGLARSLGVTAVAEGVETGEQLGELRRLGCDFAQGFLLGRPQTAKDLLFTLRNPTARQVG